VWPFAKLLNGFGSHRYVYSPIFLDSQELNHNLSTPASARAGCAASPVTTIVPELRWSPMEMQTATISGSWLQVQLLKIPVVTGFLPMGNGNAYDQLPSQVPAACASPGTMLREWRVSAMGNGECSPGSQTTLRGTRDMSKTYLSSDRDPQWRWQWSLEIEQSTSLRGADA